MGNLITHDEVLHTFLLLCCSVAFAYLARSFVDWVLGRIVKSESVISDDDRLSEQKSPDPTEEEAPEGKRVQPPDEGAPLSTSIPRAADDQIISARNSSTVLRPPQ